MECVNTKKETLYCRKIRIYPNKQQRSLFNKCLGTTRYIYNKGTRKLKDEWKQLFDKAEKNGCIKCNKELHNKLFCKKHIKCKPKVNFPLSIAKLRPLLMKSDEDLTKEEEWLKEIPYDTRQLVIRALIGNIKAALENKKRGNITHFSMGYKSKKDNKQCFYINKKGINKNYIFKTRLKKKSKIRMRKRYKKYYNYRPTSNCIIIRDVRNWFLLIPKNKEVKYQKPKYSYCALDPGVRTFQTMYSPDGIIGKFGDNLSTKLELINKRIDLLKSLRSKIKNIRTKKNLDLRCFKLRTKVKNIVNDFQWKLSNYLVKNYHVIMLPSFESQKMIKNSKLAKKTKRVFNSLSHYQFQMKMKYQCKKWQRKLMIVNESYTSKTCTRCGEQNHKLKGSKVFKCNKCNLLIDRDINGARNIFIKNRGQDEGL